MAIPDAHLTTGPLTVEVAAVGTRIVVMAAQEASPVAIVSRSDPGILEGMVTANAMAAARKTITEVESDPTNPTDMMIHAVNEGTDCHLVCRVRSVHSQHVFPVIRVRISTPFSFAACHW